MRISISRKQILIFFIILLAAGAVFLLDYFLPKYTYNFHGIQMKFSTDLKKANSIAIYPNNDTVYDILWNLELRNLTIAYVNSSDNGKVAVEAFDITYKLKWAYLMFGLDIGISGEEIDSYENLSATRDNPVISLIPPVFSNETLVEAEDNIIYIKARSYEDFDLATTKFLMAALSINI